MARRGNKDNDGKYFRLTGLWPSKKNDRLWTGKVRNQDLGKFQDKLDEADQANADVVVFLWENDEVNSKKDPEFTVQISVSEDEEGGRSRGRSSGRSRGRDRDENDDDDNNNDDDNNEEDNEPEEKEERSSRRGGRSTKKTASKGRSKGRSSSRSSKKDSKDW